MSHYVSRSKWLFKPLSKEDTPKRSIINEQCKKERKLRMSLSLQVALWITSAGDFFSHEKYGTLSNSI